MADWTDQTEQMLKTWTEAQKEVWDSWQDLAGRAMGSSSKPQSFTMNPMEWFQQSMSIWADSGGVARDAGRQVFGSQQSMMRNLELLTKAWQTIAPQVDAGDDWRSGLSSFTTDWFQQLAGIPGSFADSSKDTDSLWQSYVREWGPLLQPWLASVIKATGSGHLGEMMMGGSEGLSRLFTMGQDEFQTAPFGGLADIPTVGVAREHQAKVLRAFDAFIDLRKVMLKFNKLTIGALSKAVETTMATLVEKGEKGETIKSVRDLNRLWLDSADDVFTKMYASEEYIKAQHELSKAGMTYKIKQQDVIEMVLKGLNLPSRSELDDAYKTLYELRKEVKSLKKALQAQAKETLEVKAMLKRKETLEPKAAPANAIKQVTTTTAPKGTRAKKVTPGSKTASPGKSAE